jgi:hypothetical protein
MILNIEIRINEKCLKSINLSCFSFSIIIVVVCLNENATIYFIVYSFLLAKYMNFGIMNDFSIILNSCFHKDCSSTYINM